MNDPSVLFLQLITDVDMRSGWNVTDGTNGQYPYPCGAQSRPPPSLYSS